MAAGGDAAGAASFKLYDTYGLALEEQEDMAREFGISIDAEGFAAEMEKQRARARASWKGAEKAQINPVYQALPKTEFVGRETLEAPAKVDCGAAWTKIALDRTPFYAEAGGQVGDKGVLVSETTARHGRRRRIRLRAGSGQDRAQGEAAESDEGRRYRDRPRRPGIAPRHHAQPHRHASAACRAAHGARHARKAGRAASSNPRGCASISRITPRWTRTSWPKSSG